MDISWESTKLRQRHNVEVNPFHLKSIWVQNSCFWLGTTSVLMTRLKYTSCHRLKDSKQPWKWKSNASTKLFYLCYIIGQNYRNQYCLAYRLKRGDMNRWVIITSSPAGKYEMAKYYKENWNLTVWMLQFSATGEGRASLQFKTFNVQMVGLHPARSQTKHLGPNASMLLG